MSTTPTPETDAALLGATHWGKVKAWTCKGHTIVPADHARRLERERDEARRELAEARNELARLNGQTRWLCQCGGTPERTAELLAEVESLRADKARLEWIFAVLNVVGTRGFSERVSWRYPGITRAAIDAAMKEGTSCVSTATV